MVDSLTQDQQAMAAVGNILSIPFSVGLNLALAPLSGLSQFFGQAKVGATRREINSQPAITLDAEGNIELQETNKTGIEGLGEFSRRSKITGLPFPTPQELGAAFLGKTGKTGQQQAVIPFQLPFPTLQQLGAALQLPIGKAEAVGAASTKDEEVEVF